MSCPKPGDMVILRPDPTKWKGRHPVFAYDERYRECHRALTWLEVGTPVLVLSEPIIERAYRDEGHRMVWVATPVGVVRIHESSLKETRPE